MMEEIGELKELPKMEKMGGLGRMPRVDKGLIALKPKLLPGAVEDPLEKRAKQGVSGSLPERIIWLWLERAGYMFQTQVSLFGGRGIKGGMIIDFYVWNMAAKPVVIRVQGDYWHGYRRPSEMARDDEQTQKLRNYGYLPIDLWESDIYRYALMGELAKLIQRAMNRAA
jgi:hypothetical protein